VGLLSTGVLGILLLYTLHYVMVCTPLCQGKLLQPLLYIVLHGQRLVFGAATGPDPPFAVWSLPVVLGWLLRHLMLLERLWSNMHGLRFDGCASRSSNSCSCSTYACH
jgi:hypothetical protein